VSQIPPPVSGTSEAARAWSIPGQLQHHKSRTLADGSTVEFEFAPAGWKLANGQQRMTDWRRYYYRPAGACPGCQQGRIPGKREGTTKKCPACDGTGQPKRIQVPSVTTLLDRVIPKPGLVMWSEARGIAGAIEAVKAGKIDPQTVTDPVQAVRALKLGAEADRDRAAQRGLDVHAVLEDWATTGKVPSLANHPEEHHGYVRGLAMWLAKNRPDPHEVEQLVLSRQHGYAGRLDLIATIGGQRVLVDLKTQERAGIFAGAHAQTAMYRLAMKESGDEHVDRTMVVVVAADGAFREMDCIATDVTVQAALTWYRQIAHIESVCGSGNRVEREARAA
jgi:hypothetical protein